MDTSEKYNHLTKRLAGLATRGNLSAQMMRVDHAGELGATEIYRGQKHILQHDLEHPHSYHEIELMEKQEHIHLEYFKKRLPEQKIRPSLLYPLWKRFGFFMGAFPALLSKNNAMLCTQSVETVIGKHYDSQINYLNGDKNADIQTLKKFRDEELEHLDHAVKDGSREAYAKNLSDNFIQSICKIVIKVAQKI